MTISFKITDLEESRTYCKEYKTINELNDVLASLATKGRNYLKVWIDVIVDGADYLTDIRLDVSDDYKCFIRAMDYRANFYTTQKGIDYANNMKRYFEDAKSAEYLHNLYKGIADMCKEQQETKLDQNADCWLWMCGE